MPISGEEWRDRLRSLDLRRAIGERLAAEAPALQKRARDNADTILTRRTGDLRRGIKARGGVFQGRPNLTLESSAPYSTAQEYGAVITPKRARYLTVPMPAALDSRGVVKPEYAVPRNIPGAFVVRTERAAFLAVPGSTPGSIEILFVLKRSVRLRETAFLRRAFAVSVGHAARDVHAEIRRALEGDD